MFLLVSAPAMLRKNGPAGASVDSGDELDSVDLFQIIGPSCPVCRGASRRSRRSALATASGDRLLRKLWGNAASCRSNHGLPCSAALSNCQGCAVLLCRT